MTVPELGATGSAKVVSQFVEESDGPKLDEAGIVISGGRGLGEAARGFLWTLSGLCANGAIEMR